MDNWQIIESEFNPQEIHFHETIFTVGNGYLGTRGAFEEHYPGEQPATLIHGLYDDVPIVQTELVNAPNWLELIIFIGSERFKLDLGRVLDYHRILDLHNGVITRKVRWQSPSGQTVDIQIEHFASLAEEHVLGIRCLVTSVDFMGSLEFRAGIPGQVENAGLVHWDWSDQGRINQQSAFLEVKTRATGITLCEACHLDIGGGEDTTYDYWDTLAAPNLVARTTIKPGVQVMANKTVAIYSSRDNADPQKAAIEKLAAAVGYGYSALRAENDLAWAKEWERCNVAIEGDDEADRALRFYLFQLMIAGPRHDDRVSISARTLSGFGYRGHVFWDTEIFVLPFFIYTYPEIARNLLIYRFRTLPGARRKAALYGYEGAMYAWESAGTGDDATPKWVPGQKDGELIRIWCGEIEQHISADVAYAVFQYWRITGDQSFLLEYGAEILMEVARFWGSRATWNPAHKYYEIKDVIGPDENHEHVDNNVFTNHMARWTLQRALEMLELVRKVAHGKALELEARLDLSTKRLAHWKEIIEKIYMGFDSQIGLYEQFEGFFKRKDINLLDYEPQFRSMQSILGVEQTQHYQVLKQPDVSMLFYLLDGEYDPQVVKANYDYYTPRTDFSYGSSLGPAIQVILTARMGDVKSAYDQFMTTLRTDLKDSRGNASDGIHAATAGGLWQAVIFGFADLRITEHGPQTNPHLPAQWKRLKFRIQYKGKPYDFDLPASETGSAINYEKKVFKPPQLPILGAIFDLDGVLTDTSEFHYLAWKRLADEEGIQFTRQDNEALRGISRRESLQLLLRGRQLPEDQMQAWMDRKNHYYLGYLDHLSRDDLMPGAEELLQQMRLAGIKIAIGSGSKNARLVIEKLGIAHLVDAISDGNSVQHQKPAPDLFLHAAAQLGLPPAQCVVFEDAKAGIAAALTGGMWAVGLGPQDRVGKAHVVLPGFEKVSWTSLRNYLAQASPIDLEALSGRSSERPL